LESQPGKTGRRRAKKGLVIVHTGKGKGKTTAALGLVFRAWGHGMRVCVLQFIKRKNKNLGEYKAAVKMGIEWHQTGDGFVWDPDKMDEARAKTQRAWALAQSKIASGEYDLVVLDEFTYALDFGWLDAEEVLAWLDEYKPPELHLVITGRDAVCELIEYADLVTDMGNVKHPFDEGVQAQKGIEF
jgi:cob(I)alamin adenosyltransferase